MKSMKTYYLREKTPTGDGKIVACHKFSDFVRSGVWFINTHSNDIVTYDKLYNETVELLQLLAEYLEFDDDIVMEVDNEIYLNMNIFVEFDEMTLEEKFDFIERAKAYKEAKDND